MKCRYAFCYEPSESYHCQVQRDAGRKNHKCISVDENPYTCMFVNAINYEKLYRIEQCAKEMGIDLRHEVKERING